MARAIPKGNRQSINGPLSQCIGGNNEILLAMPFQRQCEIVLNLCGNGLEAGEVEGVVIGASQSMK